MCQIRAAPARDSLEQGLSGDSSAYYHPCLLLLPGPSAASSRARVCSIVSNIISPLYLLSYNNASFDTGIGLF